MALPPVLLESIPLKYVWVVKRDYIVRLRCDRIITIPVGFKTDLASVPRIFQNIYPSDGRYKECAIVHDYLISSGAYTRRWCDKAFFHLMLDNGIDRTTATVLYVAVRIYARVKRFL